LVKNKGLVKTVKFRDAKYVGDPINVVRIFNEKEVDELMVLQIDASSNNQEPDFRMIENLACECRMPLCYGGGVKNVEQAKRIISLGVEKVAISSAAIDCPDLVSGMAREIGSQSVVAVIDVRKKPPGGTYEVCTRNAEKGTLRCPADFAMQLENMGVGEVVVNSVDNDGVMAGYDLALAQKIRESITVPMTVLGGAGSMDDVGRLIARFGIIGAAAGSLFVFKGVYRAVLISYPSMAEKDALIEENCRKFHASQSMTSAAGKG
jgi:cyclase